MRLRTITVGLALTAGLSSAALAQRALRPKDAPAPLPETPADAGAPSSTSLSPSEQAAKRHSNKNAPAVKAAPDAGPYVKPTFKDDLTADEIARAGSSSAVLDCADGRCEGLIRKKAARREWVIHVRPSQPVLGQVAEVVADISELLEVADPEVGDKRPMEGLVPIAQIEGFGRYEMHPIDGSAGSYGFHFTPQVKGSLTLRIDTGETSNAPTAEFQIPIGQPGPKGYEVKPYEPRYADPVAWTMADLGAAWGGLWGAALGTGHGDVAALEATVQRLAKAGVEEWPTKATGDKSYAELARAFSDAAGHLQGVKPPALKDALNAMERQQCQRCHAVYAWGITSDVSAWPQFKVGKKEEE